MVGVLVDRESPLAIERQAVRSGLPVRGDVGAVVAALRPVDGELAVECPPIDAVVVGVAEEEVAPVTYPDRALGKEKSGGDALDAGRARHDRVECRVEPLDLADV